MILHFIEHASFRQNNSTTKRSKRKQRTQQTHAIRTADGMATTTRIEQQKRIKWRHRKIPCINNLCTSERAFCVKRYRLSKLHQ